jgi:hypothetical protein
MDLINDFTTKQNNLYFEMVNLTKFTFKTIQKLISEEKILSISTESIIKYMKSFNAGIIFFY